MENLIIKFLDYKYLIWNIFSIQELYIWKVCEDLLIQATVPSQKALLLYTCTFINIKSSSEKMEIHVSRNAITLKGSGSGFKDMNFLTS